MQSMRSISSVDNSLSFLHLVVSNRRSCTP